MPGNIRVAVLEALDLPTTAGKFVCVRVAVGKRVFQTPASKAQDGRTQPWNSEFLFPVLNLRDNLVVLIIDNEEKVISRAELETPNIIQKGFQDTFIPLKAGGRLHMKVSFVLSEEERRKIEAMRIASLKQRKGRQVPATNVRITEITPEESSPRSKAQEVNSNTEEIKPDVESNVKPLEAKAFKEMEQVQRQQKNQSTEPSKLNSSKLDTRNSRITSSLSEDTHQNNKKEPQQIREDKGKSLEKKSSTLSREARRSPRRTIKQKLDKWKLKEGIWSSKVTDTQRTNWLVNKRKERNESGDSSSSYERRKKAFRGVQHLVKQVLTGAIEAVITLPRKVSKKKKGLF